jgi:hypothetical protein
VIGWTQADIDELKAAIATGVLSVTFAGPPQRTVTYQSTAEMRKLLGQMVREVNGSRRYRRARFSQGFRS